MKVLVACEYSGRVRDSFIDKGHDAISCDLEPTDRTGPHYQGDLFDILYKKKWDLLIAFPPCTYLCQSGVRWLHEKPKRWKRMRKATVFFNKILEAPVPKIAIENPVMHGYARESIRKYDFSIHPWQFGDNYTKRTCFWVKNLPVLNSTVNSYGKTANKLLIRDGPKGKGRSITPWGLARAMAEQWGNNVPSLWN